MYTPQQILSENRKTGCSLNLPIAGHCTPTKNCMHCCYGRKGHTAMPSNKRKQTYVSDYLKQTDLTQLILETKRWTAVRLSGIGDLLPDHVPAILNLAAACPSTMLWGMTRKPAIATALNNQYPNLKLLLSIDSSSPQEAYSYKGAVCFGPRLATDTVPDLKNLVTVFPFHSQGKVVKNMPHHPKDCKAVWHEISGCLECNRCWNW